MNKILQYVHIGIQRISLSIFPGWLYTRPQYREWTVGSLNWNLGVHACRITHLITIMAVSQLHVLANETAELAGRSK